MGDTFANSNSIPLDARSEIVQHTASVKGPRSAFGPLWLDRQMLKANNLLAEKGWKPVRVVSQKAEREWFTAAVVFTLEGEAYAVQVILDAITDAIRERNRSCT